MKRLFILGIAALMSLTVADVQAQHIQKQRVGNYYDGDNIVMAEARTTLAVELTVEHEVFVVGPYARYAQRLLGERAPLVGRNEYRIVSAEVMLTEGDHHYEPRTTANVMEESIPTFEMPYIDKLSSVELSAEAVAEAAAAQIFTLRRARLDMVTGELGDGSIGAGVGSALQEIERLEREYLELFYGKRAKTIAHYNYIIPVEEDTMNYVIARFNPSAGVVAVDDLSGDIVLVTIRPSEMDVPVSDVKGKISYRYANNARVLLSLGSITLAERVLPIYEFGETVTLLAPIK